MADDSNMEKFLSNNVEMQSKDMFVPAEALGCLSPSRCNQDFQETVPRDKVLVNGNACHEIVLGCNEPKSSFAGRIEICQKSSSTCRTHDIRLHAMKELTENWKDRSLFDFTVTEFKDMYLVENVEFIAIRDVPTNYRTSKCANPKKTLRDLLKSLESGLEGSMHVYQLHTSSYATEELDNEEELAAANHWRLPSTDFCDLWENLVYEDDIKNNLLQYALTSLYFADHKVNASIISWNRLVLLHGPPGTGKTSLCKALAQKLSIVLSDRYQYGQLIEINSHSLFSKWFSESGKLVMKMFKKIQEFVSDPQALICVLMDEVESLSASRQSMSGNEPSDSIRVVNALLTQLDLIKRHPNVILLTTSNITGAIDGAFLDRADIRQYIGLPSPRGIYEIYHTCIAELMRAGIVSLSDDLWDRRRLENARSNDSGYGSMIPALTLRLEEISRSSVGLSGRTLRKLPFMAHALFVQSPEVIGLDRFLSALSDAVLQHFKDAQQVATPNSIQHSTMQ